MLGHRGESLVAARATRALVGAVLFAVFGLTSPVAADTLKLRAAFLYSFATYTSWPDSAFGDESESACFAVIEEPALAEALRKLVKEKQLHGRAIEVLSLSGDDVRHHCQVAYLGDGASVGISPSAPPDPILTVGTSDSFLKRGGVIRLFRKANKLKFMVNRGAATRANLRLSSKLLRLAIEVID
jgi:hypothetical protein